MSYFYTNYKTFSNDEIFYSGLVADVCVEKNDVGFGAALCLTNSGTFNMAQSSELRFAPCMALALEEGTGYKEVLLQGFVNNNLWDWQPAKRLILSSTAGELTQDELGSFPPCFTGSSVGMATSSGGMYFSPNMVHAGTYTWAYRKTITIDYTKVDEGITDYVALVKITADNDLRTVSNAGHVESTEGYDIVFSMDGLTIADFEVVKYVPTTGELVAYVRIPTLSSTEDTVFYMYYGNEYIVYKLEDKINGTYNSYDAVFHLNLDNSDGSYGEYVDSTGNSNGAHGYSTGGVYYPTQVSGVIAYAQDFYDSGRNMIFMEDDVASLIEDSENYTIEFWAAPDDETQSGYNRVFAFDSVYWYRYDGVSEITSTTYTSSNVWRYIVLVIEEANVFLYVDSAPASLTAGGPSGDSGYDCIAGGYGSASYSLIGKMEEVRISNGAKTVDYITTTYKNQNSPSTFYSVGSEEIL
jgi:hypothetical protein